MWLYFDFLDQDSAKVKCKICAETVQHSGNISNMLKHLKKKHPVESAEIEAKRKSEATASTSTSTSRQLTLHDSFTKAGKYPGM